MNLTDINKDRKVRRKDNSMELGTMMFGDETWKPIIDYEGIYIISNYGVIMRIFYKGKPCKKLLKNKVTQKGYFEIGLRDKNNDRKFYLVHRLVGKIFVLNPYNKPHINHLDTNKQNNYYKNLEWSTPAENVKHSWLNGLNTKTFIKGQVNGERKLSIDQVLKIKLLIKEGISIPKIAESFSMSYGCIYKIKSGGSYAKIK